MDLIDPASIIYNLLSMMKNMTCVNHKEAELVCINPECTAKCSYLCLQTDDSCRHDHQRCSVAFISFLLRRSSKIIAKAHDLHIQQLINLQKQASTIIATIDHLLTSYHLLTKVKQVLDPHGLLQSGQKDIIRQYLTPKYKDQTDISLSGLEKDLNNLNTELVGYLQVIKEERKKEQQIKNKKENNGHGKQSGLKSKIAMPSPVKSGLREVPELNSKLKQKQEKINSAIKGPSQVSAGSRVVSSFKQHIPKPPFFSKITNDVQTLNTFFYHKFNEVKLLYRASQNDFSVAKFHEKCNGFQNTITIILTEGQKVIGGFTPLPWKSGGGEWYQDPKQATFLFSLSSGERYPLINKQRAIWCSQAFGPSFGHPDLQIADKSAFNSNSCCNFPQSFNNGNYTLSAGSTQLFCGSKNGHFKIKEWQVYQLTF